MLKQAPWEAVEFPWVRGSHRSARGVLSSWAGLKGEAGWYLCLCASSWGHSPCRGVEVPEEALSVGKCAGKCALKENPTSDKRKLILRKEKSLTQFENV